MYPGTDSCYEKDYWKYKIYTLLQIHILPGNKRGGRELQSKREIEGEKERDTDRVVDIAHNRVLVIAIM